MSNRRKLTRGVLVALTGVVGLAACLASCFYPTDMFFDYYPIPDAADAAFSHAEGEGLQLYGWSGDWEQETDAFGGCVVRIKSDDLKTGHQVTMRLRRSWRLSGWSVEEMSISPPPKP